MFGSSSHRAAVLQALFVTFLWSSSWVLVKIGLEDIPALTFAGLRYFLAFLVLLPFTLRGRGRDDLRNLTRGDYLRLGVLGLIFIAVTQGAQFSALQYLPAVTLSLLLNFTTIFVAVLGIVLLAEMPSARQWGGVALYMVGVFVYFYPAIIPQGEALGLMIGALCVLANSASTIMGRGVNRGGVISPLTVTVVSMGAGSTALLLAGLATEGVPTLTFENWAIIAWLAVVSTAVAFPLWNNSLRTLSAVESSIINNTMLVQIAVLAWLFLGETLTPVQVAGMALVLVATFVVQSRKSKVEGLKSKV